MAGLIRLLILAAIAWYGYRYLRDLLFTRVAQAQAERQSERKPELMQRCSQCGVHIPLGESTQSRGHVFCSESHRDTYFRNPPHP